MIKLLNQHCNITIGDASKPRRPALQIYNEFEYNHFISKTSLNLDEWHHITAVHREGKSYIYINGTLTDTAKTLTPRQVLRNNNFIGRHRQTPEGPYFDGVLDELKIFSIALDEEEILREMIDGKKN